MPTTVVRDAAEAVLYEEKHLSVPHVGVQRPAVRERHDRALTPVLLVDLRPILGSDRAHGLLSLVACEAEARWRVFPEHVSCRDVYRRHRDGSLFAEQW